MHPDPADGLEILVVDDDDLMREWVGAVLVDMGHVVIPAVNGEEALDLFKQRHPDLVLLDHVMPGMSGSEVARKIRDVNAWIPIIFVSAYGGNEEVLEGLHAGGDDYLFKPVNYEILGAKIKVYQERLRMSRMLRNQNDLLLGYRDQIREEQNLARDFIDQFIALDKINDPLVHFLLNSADNFSGDLVAVARTPDDRLHVLLADSAGHGLTSALAVIPITQPFYQMTGKGFDVPSIVKEINCSVRAYLPLPRYVAVVVISIDRQQQVIQAWNGGCPEALFFDEKNILHRFKSRHLPLGVLSAAEFDATVEYFDYSQQAGRLLLCSDGATELLVSGGQNTDIPGVISGMAYSSAKEVVGALAKMYEKVLKGHAPPDDIALMVVDCLPSDHVLPRVVSTHAQQIAPVDLEKCETVWQFASTLSAAQLKHLDVIPFLLNVTSQIDGVMADGKVFMVLSELFNNALDHGVLQLDSMLKNQIDGMDNYFRVRAARLDALEGGQITVRLTKQNCSGYMRLLVHMIDSGAGFDYRAIQQGDAALNVSKSGRGIALLASMCSDLRYVGEGSEVYASIDLLAGQ